MAYSDTGFFGIYAGTDDNDAPELMQVVMDQMERAASTITEAEVARAKAQMKATLMMALESSSARAEQMARHIMVYGRPLPLSEIVAKIEAVTVESTQAAARALLGRSRPAIAGLGPGRELDHAAEIVENFARATA
jgi:predicted Zn-dependent peptidase